MRQIILDTETTGLAVSEGHRIIEVAAIEMRNREKTGRYLHFYVNPGRAVDEGAIRVHGITNQFLKDKPAFSVIAAELLAFLEGAELLIHNAAFDLGFLNKEFSLWDKSWPGMANYCSVLDTLNLAKEKHRGARNSLDALCKRYKISNAHRKFHGALLDSELLAEVYLAMTGGQITLFLDAPENAEAKVGKITQEPEVGLWNRDGQSKQSFRVVLANEAENQAHQDYLKTLEKACPGKVVFSNFLK